MAPSTIYMDCGGVMTVWQLSIVVVIVVIVVVVVVVAAVVGR